MEIRRRFQGELNDPPSPMRGVTMAHNIEQWPPHVHEAVIIDQLVEFRLQVGYLFAQSPQ
eukprot:2371755-Pyramimonas_sp.AAC.1